ncbi:metabotropic glutamate receptor 2-like isoform X3 [Varroa destructor]|uniref:G-protein coupled receptors family 3 profile domain-containing protein n=1 Tax=Varroa destructor TaxID=109461 RepID=A0A7M7MCD5_VARDE|nr:metabotropic glutamate receptor 2-like isoform X3 [Varroa destructor]
MASTALAYTRRSRPVLPKIPNYNNSDDNKGQRQRSHHQKLRRNEPKQTQQLEQRRKVPDPTRSFPRSTAAHCQEPLLAKPPLPSIGFALKSRVCHFSAGGSSLKGSIDGRFGTARSQCHARSPNRSWLRPALLTTVAFRGYHRLIVVHAFVVAVVALASAVGSVAGSHLTGGGSGAGGGAGMNHHHHRRFDDTVQGLNILNHQLNHPSFSGGNCGTAAVHMASPGGVGSVVTMAGSISSSGSLSIGKSPLNAKSPAGGRTARFAQSLPTGGLVSRASSGANGVGSGGRTAFKRKKNSTSVNRAGDGTDSNSFSGGASSSGLGNLTWPLKRVAHRKGEVMLGALMMVHERHANWTCGPIMPQGGIQALECMLFTIDYVNRQEWMPSNVSFGYYILDDCDSDTYGLEQAVDFIKGSFGKLHNSNEQITCSQTHKDSTDGSQGSSSAFGGMTSTKSAESSVDVISGVLGAASSVTSIQVANLLRLFRIPQISFFSTSPELSNKQRFEYFLRTVPSDRDQAAAMVEIVKLLRWTYVSIVYEESNYGIQAFAVLESLLAQEGICIAAKEKLTKDSGQGNAGAYDQIVERLRAKSRARGVIVFGSDQEVAHLMKAVARGNATGMFSWIGSDGWSARSLVSDGHEAQVEGTISVQPMAHPIPDFESYFLNLTAQGNKRNPWFIEYWEYTFRCRWPNGTVTPYNQKYTSTCTGREKLLDPSATGGFELERQLQFVSDAVLAFAYAIRDMHEELCGGSQGLCHKMKPIEGSQLLSYLKRVRFNGLTKDEFRFTESTLDGPSRYNILHFKQTKPGIFDWLKVGEYRDGRLTLNKNELKFRIETSSDMSNKNLNGTSSSPISGTTLYTSAEDSWSRNGGFLPPVSVCSLECERGSAKKFLEGEKCCWQCMPCQKYEVLRSETECVECAKGTLPDLDHQVCLEIPAQHVNPASSWATGAMAFASAGVVLTFCVIYVFIRYRDTPVVRASGRELSAVLLTGILLCYSVTFILVQKPTDLICGLQRIGVSLSFTIVYAAILTKSNRIARIFRAGKRTSRRPSFISPKSQLIICAILVSLQVVVIVVWLLFIPPRAVKHYPTREQSQLLCESTLGSSWCLVSFTYPALLICVCTAYAVLTRAIPEAFNESKYIGFTMYTTCIIWLSFVPLYLTVSGPGSSQLAIGVTVMCVSISLSASVTLVCMFAPKLYIILLHPEKNVRQPVVARFVIIQLGPLDQRENSKPGIQKPANEHLVMASKRGYHQNCCGCYGRKITVLGLLVFYEFYLPSKNPYETINLPKPSDS